MPKINLILSISIFSILLIVTSIVKNQTRIIEKKIYKVDKNILILKKDFHETELDYSYLSSPKYLSEKIKEIGLIQYTPMDFSRIYLDYQDFTNSNKKITKIKNPYEKKN